MERERNPSLIFAQPKTHEFLISAIEDGAIERTLEMYRQARRWRDKKFRDLNILATYLGGDASSDAIADTYPDISHRSTVPGIIRRTLKDVWSNTSDEIRSQFPLETLEAAKPLSLKSRMKMSKTRSGPSAIIYELINEGASYENILSRTGMTPDKLSKFRQVLTSWGAELPHRKSKTERLMDLLRSSENDAEIQAALDRINNSFYLAHLTQEVPVVLPVYKVARMSGFFLRQDRLRDFIDTLHEAQIPLGEWKPKPKKDQVTYYFIATQHFDRAKQAFYQDPKLQVYQDNPVKLVYGPEGKTPAISDFVHSKRYKSPGYLFRALGIPVGRVKGIRYRNFFDASCPVSIFKFYRAYYFEADQENLLIDYIKGRAQELGILN